MYQGSYKRSMDRKIVELNVEALEDRIAPSSANFPPGQFPSGNPAHARGQRNPNEGSGHQPEQRLVSRRGRREGPSAGGLSLPEVDSWCLSAPSNGNVRAGCCPSEASHVAAEKYPAPKIRNGLADTRRSRGYAS